MMRRLITNNFFMATLSAALIICGVVISVLCHDFFWLNRFGALVICSSIIIVARPAILHQSIRTEVIMATGFSLFDNRHFEALGEPVPEWLIQDRYSRTAVGWLGPLFLFIGTLATGFGDLINRLVCYGSA